MSIIYDALKKIEKGVGNAPLSGKESRGKEVKIKKRPNPVLIYILIVLAGLLVVKTTIGLLAPPKIEPPPPPPPIPQITANTAPEEVLPEEKSAPEPEPKPDPELTLNGAYFQRDEGYALINNRIVKTGDTIQGAIVKEIGLEKVTLEFEGRTITLISSPQ